MDTVYFGAGDNNFYALEATTKLGRSYRLNPEVFGPYKLIFAQNRFFYLVREPIVADTFGGVDNPLTFRRLQAATVADIENIISSHGMRVWDAKGKGRFERFVSRYLCLMGKNGGPTNMSIVAPPRHIYIEPSEERMNYQDRIETVEVRFVETFYNGRAIKRVTDRVVTKIRICAEPEE